MSTQESTSENHGASRPEPNATPSSSKLSSLKSQIAAAIPKIPDFPKPGILFEDVLPLFSDVVTHQALIEAYEILITDLFGEDNKPDVIVGLDARGFLFGPTIALRLGAAFVPVRKPGKLPGKIETADFEKEYGKDTFAIQSNSIKPGQKVLVVDDLIATGGSASAAGTLVKKCGGELMGYIFIIELSFLHGRARLDAPVWTIVESQP